MTITLDMPTSLERRLTTEAARRGLPVPELVLHLVQNSLSEAGPPNTEATALIQSWIDDPDIEKQRHTGEFLTKALHEDRPSDRQFFPNSEKGRSW